MGPRHPGFGVFGALLMVLAWRRQRRRLKEQLRLSEAGWEFPDA